MAERVGGLSLGQLLLALDRTMVTLVEAPRGLDMPVGSVALVDVDDVRLGLAVGAGSADLFFLLGVSDAEAVGWIAQQVHGAAQANVAGSGSGRRGDLRQGTVGRRGEAGRRTRHGGGGRRTPRPLGVALQTGQPRVRAPRRPRRPALRLRHRPVRAGAVDRRPHPRHDQHRGRPIPCAGVFGVQRRGRRTAPADHPGPRRPARAPGVDRPVGHLRRAAGQRRRRPRRRTPGVGPAAAARRRHPPPRDRCATPARLRGHDLAAAGIGAAGRRRRGGAARRGGAGGTNHVAAGGRAVDAHGAGAEPARARRRRRRRRRDRPRTGHHRRRPCGVGRFPRRRHRGAGQRDRVERERFSRRCAGGVDRRTGVCAVAEDRGDVVADVVGARHGRRAAPRAGPDTARGDRRPADRAGRRGGGPRRSGPRVRQRRSPPRRHRSGHVAGRSAHHGAARRDRRACGRAASGSSTRGCASCASRIRCWPTRWPPIWTGSATSPQWRSGCMCTRTRCATASVGSRSCCRRRWTTPTTGSSSPLGLRATERGQSASAPSASSSKRSMASSPSASRPRSGPRSARYRCA